MKTIYILLLMLVITSCSKEEYQEEQSCSGENLANYIAQIEGSFVTDILSSINEYRTENSLDLLVLDNSCALKLAIDHTNYMIANNRLSHDNFSNRITFLQQSGANQVGENVAKGYDNARDLLTAWSNSLTHDAVLLGNFNRAAIATIQDDRGTYYFTLLLYRS